MNSSSLQQEPASSALTSRFVFFDAVGTLIRPAVSVGEVYADVGRQYGAELPPDVIEQRFREAVRRQDALDRELGLRTSETRERERWRSIVAEVFHDQPDPTAPFAALWDHFGRPGAWTCYPDVTGCLAALRSHGLQWGIASNFDSRLHAVIAGLPELHTCTTVVVSSEVGWRKPASGFFATLLAAAQQPAAQVLLVGDDWTNDHEGGTAAGLLTALVNRTQSSGCSSAVLQLTDVPLLLGIGHASA